MKWYRLMLHHAGPSNHPEDELWGFVRAWTNDEAKEKADRLRPMFPWGSYVFAEEVTEPFTIVQPGGNVCETTF